MNDERAQGMQLTVKIRQVLWFRAYYYIMLLLNKCGIINADTAVKLLTNAVLRGYKYKVGQSEWKPLGKHKIDINESR